MACGYGKCRPEIHIIDYHEGRIQTDSADIPTKRIGYPIENDWVPTMQSN